MVLSFFLLNLSSNFKGGPTTNRDINKDGKGFANKSLFGPGWGWKAYTKNIEERLPY
jgi:hypothetical protein